MMKIQEWFDNSEWAELSIEPDTSIDIKQLDEQVKLNPKVWVEALSFLSNKALSSLELGKYILQHGVYATVSDYATKESGYFEAHNKYIDIQLLLKGKEYIQVSSMESNEIGEVIEPYDEVKDIYFFNIKPWTEHLLSTSNFMIFFPSEAHKPCLKVESSEMVRKLVIKVPYHSA